MNRILRLAPPSNSCPEGTPDNSPTFQRWEPMANVMLVPKGRPKDHTVSVVPSGLMTFCGRLPNVETLGYYRPSLRDEDAILVAADWKVRAPATLPAFA